MIDLEYEKKIERLEASNMRLSSLLNYKEALLAEREERENAN